jgi:hypothetical protein
MKEEKKKMRRKTDRVNKKKRDGLTGRKEN